jgi:hypothetical protein
MLLAHFVADFLLQRQAGVEERRQKKWKSSWLYVHSALYALVVYASSLAWDQVTWLFPLFFVSHALIDGLKTRHVEKAGAFVIDQSAHLGLLVAAWAVLAPGRFTLIGTVLQDGLDSPAILLVLTAFLVNLFPVGYLIGYLTEPLRRQLDSQKKQGLEKAGFWIGCLERFFVLSFILVGYPEGIAILAGAKSVFRYGEIKGPEKRVETEYILIGTLLSYAIAFGSGILVKNLVR